MNTKKKLLLVQPRSPSNYARIRSRPRLSKKGGLMNVSLATIAALTPPDFEVEIVDEDKQTISFDGHYDLVGITGLRSQVGRAKCIAEEFRKRGTLVVCGGPSASISPERWRSFSDVLFIGEAERTWPAFVEDYLAGSHKEEYRETERFDLDVCPFPDYSGLPKKVRESYVGGFVQTSRGCPFDCEFCAVVIYAGHRMRYKPVDLVIKEVEQLYRFGIRFVFLADDNFSADREKSKDVLRALRDWNQRQRTPMMFFTQVSIDVAGDEEFLELAAESGLNHVLIGIESPNVDSLREAQKLHNVKTDMLQDIKRFHQHGIAVTGTSILGFDHDDLSVFQRHFDFFTEAGVISAYPFPIDARDGTRLKERVMKEGRYIDQPPVADPSTGCTFHTFTMRPKQMSVEQLRQGVYWLAWELYKPEHVAQRVKRFFEHFEGSPKKTTLRIPKGVLGWQGLVILARLLTYYLTGASQEERRVLRQMLHDARGSSHPQAVAIALKGFVEMKKAHAVEYLLDPDIENIRYPVPSRAAELSA